jgi:hypothetical protein
MAKTRSLPLDGSVEAHVKAFKFWWQGFLQGGHEELTLRSKPPLKPMTWGDRKIEAGVIRALSAISNPAPEAGGNLRTLMPGTMTLTLTEEQFAILVKYVQQTMWSVGVIADVDDALMLLETAAARA